MISMITSSSIPIPVLVSYIAIKPGPLLTQPCIRSKLLYAGTSPMGFGCGSALCKLAGPEIHLLVTSAFRNGLSPRFLRGTAVL